MSLSDNAMSALLLCSAIGISKTDCELKPFTLTEWNRFLDRVTERGMEPKVVLEGKGSLGKDLGISPEEESRITALCRRGGSVAIELDELSKRGIEVATVFSSSYPVLMKRTLKRKSPPVLFYAGDISLAGKIGISIVGSRNVDEDGMRFAEQLARKAALEKLVLYSGGANGVDRVAETSAVQNGGATVSYVADSLTSRIRKRSVVKDIMEGRLLLISDVKPDVGFTVARAMNRNKYIYSSAYGSFVVSSDYRRGGTWAGATEALRNGWSKVLVWDHAGYEGNRKLIELGAVPYELSDEKLYAVITRKKKDYEQLELFNTMPA